MNWIKYLLEANLYLALFFAAYYLLMRRETYYQLNRAYLLGSSTFAFIIPLLQLGFLKRPAEPVQVSFNSSFDTAVATHITSQPAGQIAAANINGTNYYFIVYVTIALLLAIGLGIRLFQLARLAKRGKRHTAPEFNLIEIDEDDRAFSFFNYLFIGKKLSASTTVIQHELVHIRQLHSLDIIYLELLKIICWFNPVVYLLQHSLKEIHEFIADSHIAASQQDVDDYTDFLIGNAYGLSETTLTNNFFNNKLLKTRIIMLHQKKSGSLARLKYLIALPLLAVMLCLSTLGFTKDYTVIDLAPGHSSDITKPVLTKPAHIPSTVTPAITPQQTPLKPKVAVLPAAVLPKPEAAVQPSTPSQPEADVQPAAPLADIAPPLDTLYSQLARQVKYPAVAREKHIQGRVFASFDVDNNHKIQNITIVRSPDDALSNEVIRALNKCKPISSIKQGVTYTLPISFSLLYNDPNKKVESSTPDTKLNTNNTAGPHHAQRVDLSEVSITAQAPDKPTK